MVDIGRYEEILKEVDAHGAKLIAVSKTVPEESILELMKAGQKAFGENYVQELEEKQKHIPDAEWHFIGHLQTNKVKKIISFSHLIHSVDSMKLLKEIDKQAKSAGRVQDCLVQIHIAREESKFGLKLVDAEKFLADEKLRELKNVNLRGVMGMTTLTDDEKLVRSEFKALRKFFEAHKRMEFDILSMGMTGDYRIALEEGSTMVRIGSAIFGERQYH